MFRVDAELPARVNVLIDGHNVNYVGGWFVAYSLRFGVSDMLIYQHAGGYLLLT